MEAKAMTKAQLLGQVTDLEQQVKELELANAEHDRAEAALIESEERWNSLVQNTYDVIQLLDTDGRITWQNRVYPPDEMIDVIGKCAIDFVDENCKEIMADALKEVLKGNPQTFEAIVHLPENPSGPSIYFEIKYIPMGSPDGKIEKVISIGSNITERKQADEEIRESEKRFRTIFEVANDAMIYLDKDGTVLDVNDKLEDIFGFTREEVIGKNFSEIPFLDLSQMARMVDLYADAVSMEGPRLLEFELLHKDGHPISVEASSTTVIDRAGIKGDLTILRDITERKKGGEERARMKALEELDQLRTALLASVSHELRTPLTSIKGLASTLVQPDVEWDDETQVDFLKSIVQESDKLNHIVSDLLQMSLIEAGIMRIEKTETRISAIVKQLDGELRNITQMHSLKINIPPNIPRIHADEIRIGEVITNLVSNAASYSDEGSNIFLEATQSNNDIVVIVSDEGIGISPEHQHKVFDRFYRLESGVSRRRGGSGLGLAICKGIVEGHGGQISVESKPGEGSKFIFSVPIAQHSESEHDSPIQTNF